MRGKRRGIQGKQDLPELSDRHGAFEVTQDLQQNPRPVAAVAELAQVREWLLRRPHTLFYLRQLIAEGNEEFAITLSLEWRQGEDAGQVVAIWRLLLLCNRDHALRDTF